MNFFVVIFFITVFTLAVGHPLEKSSEDENGNDGTSSSTGMRSSTPSSVPSLRRSKLLSSRRRINSRMMVDPQLPSESSRVENQFESSGTFRTMTNDEEPQVRSSTRRQIQSQRRAIPLTRSESDQSRKPSSASLRQQPYTFPLPVSSTFNIRRSSSQYRKKVAPGFTTDKKKISEKKVENNKEDEEEISSEGVSLNPPEFEEVRNSPSVKLDINTIGRLMSNPKKSGSLIDLASYRRVSNGQDPVFYGNDMIFHREPSYDDDETVDRTRNSLSIDPNSEFVLIKK